MQTIEPFMDALPKAKIIEAFQLIWLFFYGKGVNNWHLFFLIFQKPKLKSSHRHWSYPDIHPVRKKKRFQWHWYSTFWMCIRFQAHFKPYAGLNPLLTMPERKWSVHSNVPGSTWKLLMYFIIRIREDPNWSIDPYRD